MNNKIVSIIAIIALVVALIGWVLPTKVQEILGGSVHNTFETFDEGIGVDGITRISGDGDFVFGGGVLTKALTASASLTAAELCDYGLIRQNPIAAEEADVGASMSFPTEAALIADCIPNPGDMHQFLYENTATTYGRNIEFVVGGGDIIKWTNSDVSIQQNETAIVQFYNIDDASVSYNVIVADN